MIWSGLPESESEALEKYDIDTVSTTDQIETALAHPYSKPYLWAIEDQVSAHTSLSKFEKRDLSLLKTAIEECRVVKDSYEIALTKKANVISTIAHTAVLQAVKAAKNERELEGLFIAKCIANGAREQAYSGIFASGTSAATLHYVTNDQALDGKLNFLLDAGGELNCYASDIVSAHLPSLSEPWRLLTVGMIDKDVSHQRQILKGVQGDL